MWYIETDLYIVKYGMYVLLVCTCTPRVKHTCTCTCIYMYMYIYDHILIDFMGDKFTDIS